MPRTLSPHTWHKQYAKKIREQLGPNYPMPRQDWEDGEYMMKCQRLSPADAAQKVVARRREMVPFRHTCKAWFDKHDENGIHQPNMEGGQFRCEPCVPPDVLITIRAAIDNGCTHGTVSHWENAYPQFRHLQDVRPVLFLWEML